jgi:hypothetical protein
MIEFRQKEFAIGGVLGAGLSNLGAGVGTAAAGVAKGAAVAGKGLLAGAVPATVGAGQVAASGLAAGAGILGKAALWGAAHPLILGGLGAYALYRILKRRRERRMQERGYSVIEKMYSEGLFSNVEYRKAVRRVGKRELKDGVEHYSSESVVEEKSFATIPAGQRTKVMKIIAKTDPEMFWSPEVIERADRIRGTQIKRKLKSIFSRPKNSLKLAKAFSDVSEQLSIPMPTPKAPRELVPKKIVKKAKKSGVVQKDSDGNWRIINMHGPQGPIYWKPVYKSKESAENCLRAYQAGKWNKK